MFTDILFYSSLALLMVTTVWTIGRTRGLLNAAVLVPLAWILLIPIPVILRPYTTPTGLFPEGFIGAPKDNLFIAMTMANLSFSLFQWFVLSPWFKALQAWTIKILAPNGVSNGHTNSNGDNQLLRAWVLGLTIIAVALAVAHLALMPRIPSLDLFTGFANPLQPNYDREAASKFLEVPTIFRYIFNWNRELLFPILFAAAVMMRWKWLAIAIGIIGAFYVTSTLDKAPILVFILAPFIAIAVRDRKPMWSKLVIGGVLISIIGPLAVNQGPGLSTSLHAALHINPPAIVVPADYASSITQQVPGCESTKSLSTPFNWEDIPASLRDLIVRRVGVVPAEVTYGWFAYFPAQAGFLKGSGWTPWKVISPTYKNPANAVGLWMYCGHVVTLPTVSAYGSFIADGWAEFGLLGVLIACLGMILFAVVLELIRGFLSKPLCLAAYAPALILFASLPPRAGLLATVGSSGLFLVPLLCLLYLLSERIQSRRAVGVAKLEPVAGS